RVPSNASRILLYMSPSCPCRSFFPHSIVSDGNDGFRREHAVPCTLGPGTGRFVLRQQTRAMYDYQGWLVGAVHVVLATATAGHALLYKRQPQAALGWIAVCVFFPIVGPLLYVLFGVNRVHIAARELNRRSVVD